VRCVSFNVNGIRAAVRRGFRAWLEACDPDVVALQEVRCRPEDLPPNAFTGYHLTYDAGELAGRNGVALLTRQPPAATFAWHKSGDQLTPFAKEGRLIGVELADAPLTVVSIYVPKGGVPIAIAPEDGGREGYSPEQLDERYKRKLAFLHRFAAELARLRVLCERAGRHLLVMGDLNIAHAPADLHNWRGNLSSEGFLPAERAWLDAAVGPAASTELLARRTISAPTMTWPPFIRPFVDVARHLRPDENGPYSWWSWQGQAFAKDIGWRIDYHLASPKLADLATNTWVDKAADPKDRVSDHAAVVTDYTLTVEK